MKCRSLIPLVVLLAFLSSCGSNATKTEQQENKTTDTVKKQEAQPAPPPAAANDAVTDGPAIATLETESFILKIHRAIEFTPAPKAYQAFKIKEGHKLVALDVSVKSKLSGPLDMGMILTMSALKDGKAHAYMAPWVVAAYMIDNPDPVHQKEYDALWSNKFGAGEFHRAILLGMDPPAAEKDFTLTMPEKADFNAAKKSVKFSLP